MRPSRCLCQSSRRSPVVPGPPIWRDRHSLLGNSAPAGRVARLRSGSSGAPIDISSDPAFMLARACSEAARTTLLHAESGSCSRECFHDPGTPEANDSDGRRRSGPPSSGRTKTPMSSPSLRDGGARPPIAVKGCRCAARWRSALPGPPLTARRPRGVRQPRGAGPGVRPRRGHGSCVGRRRLRGVA